MGWEPAFSNLFQVSFIMGPGYEGDSDYYGYGVPDTLPTSFLCTKVSFPEQKLEFNRPKNLADFFISGVGPISEITIDWMEDFNLSVRKYHEDWARLFWDPDNFNYISAETPADAERRYRSASIKLSSSEVSNNSRAELYLTDLLPTSIPGLNLSFDNADAMTYSITYKVTKWEIFYSPLYGIDRSSLNR